MYFDFHNDKYDNTNYNHWYFSKRELEMIKKHILNLKYFEIETSNIIDKILSTKNYDNKKLIIKTEYTQDNEEILELLKTNSTLEYQTDDFKLKTFTDSLNIVIDKMYCILDENTSIKKVKEMCNLLKFKPKLLKINDDKTIEDVKEIIIYESKKNDLNNILILTPNFFFNNELLKNLSNLNINIPDDFSELYFDYCFEQNNYRENNYLINISNYNKDKTSIVNIKSKSYKYYGIYPILNKLVNPKTDMMIKKFNYMRNKYLFQTLLINLDRRRDRFENYMLRNGDIYPNVLRFSAIDGKTFNFKRFLPMFDISEYNKHKNIKNPYQTHNYLKGTLGCSMSHYTIWKILSENIKLNDNDYILVLEDDVIFSENFNSKLNKLLDYLHYDEEWDVVFLGIHDYVNYNDIQFNDMLVKLSGELRMRGAGAFSYFIRKKAAKKYLEYAEKYKIQQAIDYFMLELFDKMTVYKCEPEIIFSPMANNIIGADSDIQNSNETIFN